MLYRHCDMLLYRDVPLYRCPVCGYVAERDGFDKSEADEGWLRCICCGEQAAMEILPPLDED